MGSEPERSLQNSENCLHQYLPHPAGASFPAAARLSMDKTWVFSPAFFLHCYDLRSELVHGGNVRDAHEQANVIAAALAVLFPTYSWRDLRAVQGEEVSDKLLC
jgi:hypothetical protein